MNNYGTKIKNFGRRPFKRQIEAEGDIEVDQDYSAEAVSSRIERIKDAMYADITALAKDIELE